MEIDRGRKLKGESMIKKGYKDKRKQLKQRRIKTGK